MREYTGPIFKVKHFRCECGAVAEQHWTQLLREDKTMGHPHRGVPTGLWACTCDACGAVSVWEEYKAGAPGNVFGRPITPTLLGNTAHPDMPTAVKAVFDEARQVSSGSPRSAAALLRLASEMFCDVVLGPVESKDLNLDGKIAKLVKNGLPIMYQQGLDSLRVIGNNAVHPGLIDFSDASETTTKLFGILNALVEQLITQPRIMAGIFDFHLTSGQKDHVENRDVKQA